MSKKQLTINQPMQNLPSQTVSYEYSVFLLLDTR